MSLISKSIDYAASAASTAAKARGVLPIEQTRDSLDVVVALKCIGSYQSLSTIEELQQLDSEDFAAPLIAAARTLQSMAEHLQRTNVARPDEANDLFLHSAIAQAMCGNLPSASAVLKLVDSEYLIGTRLRLMVAVICDPRSHIATQRNDPLDGLGDFRYHWYYALRILDDSTRRTHIQAALELLTNVARHSESTVADRAYYLSILVAAKQAYRLATVGITQFSSAIPHWFVEGAVSAGLITLLPPQHELICKSLVADQAKNALLTLPTSTGKTFIAEACIAATTSSEGISVYVAPYVAIGEQVKASLQQLGFERKVQVVSMFGGFKSEYVEAGFERAVIVATPERFDAWLRTTEQLASLRLVVFDEIHIVESDTRGTRVEGILSRLRLLQGRHKKLRVLGLSAVLPDSTDLAAWMGVPTEGVHQMGWRPTARRLATCSSNGYLQWLHGNDSLRPEGARPDTPISYPVQISLPYDVYPARNINSFEAPAAKNVSNIVTDLLGRLGSPGLVVCPRRSDTRFIAREMAGLLPAIEDPHILAYAADLRKRHSWLSLLASCLERGVAYHNASLPFDVRREIEKAIREYKLKVVCSTTTLAEGADFPFRWTLVSHWLSSFRGDGTPMKSMTFRNIAGRSGRAGWLTEGDTILFENTIGPTAAFGNRGKRPSPDRLTKVMFSSAPIESTIGQNWEDVEEDEQNRVRAAFSSQFLACIREHPEAEDVATLFAHSTYSANSAGIKNIRGVIREALSLILDAQQPGGAFAVQNSPIQLTPLGHYANQSGFSPISVRKMLEYLATPRDDWNGGSLLSNLLIYFYSIDEQPSYILKNVVDKGTHRFPMKARDLPVVIENILAGMDVRKVFDSLPASMTSKAQPDYIEAKFDQFVTFVDSTVWGFLPWLLRALELFAPFGSSEARNVPWAGWATHIENRSPTGSTEVDANSSAGSDEPF